MEEKKSSASRRIRESGGGIWQLGIFGATELKA